MPLDGLHHDRGRAAAFGDIAERYHRFRSRYPSELASDLVRDPRVRDVLDVGAGTGLATLALTTVRPDLRVVGVEPDERMAAVARAAGQVVELAAFEEWDDAGRQFDLVVAGGAWHWIDPAQGTAKVDRLLRPGGRVARFWNVHAVDPAVLGEFTAVYRALAPELYVVGTDAMNNPDASDPFETLGYRCRSRRYRWARRFGAEEWAGLVGTFSDHLALGPHRVAALQTALIDVIHRRGGIVDVRGGTYLVDAVRPEQS